jgi:O-antigen ligase
MAAPVAFSLLVVEVTGRWRKSFSGRRAKRTLTSIFAGLFTPRGVLLFLSFILIVTGIIFSHSRMGIFSFLGSLVVFGFFLSRKGAVWRDGLVFIVLLGVALLYAYNMGVGSVLDRYSTFFERDIWARKYLWDKTLGIIKAYPLFGTGLGTFRFISRSVLPSSLYYAHNDYLNLASDAGLVGFGLAGAAMAFWGSIVFRAKARGLSGFRRIMLAGPVAAVAALLFHSVSDFNLQIPGNAFHFFLMMGLALAIVNLRDRD